MVLLYLTWTLGLGKADYVVKWGRRGIEKYCLRDADEV